MPVVPGAAYNVVCLNGVWLVARPRSAAERGASGPPYEAIDGPFATREDAEHRARLLTWKVLRGEGIEHA